MAAEIRLKERIKAATAAHPKDKTIQATGASILKAIT
jgi:hypothetical protein